MVIGKTGQAGSVAILDGEGPKAPRFNLLFQMIRGLKFSERLLDRDFHRADGADVNRMRGIKQDGKNGAADPLRIRQSPKKHVGIEQVAQTYSPENRRWILGSTASKLAEILIFPPRPPNRRGCLPGW